MRSYRRKKSNALVILPVLLICALVLFLQTRWVNKHQDLLMSDRFQRLLHQGTPHLRVRALCSHCEGSGIEKVEFEGAVVRRRCPVCQGLGSARIQIKPKVEAICPRCGGMGSQLDSSQSQAINCPECKGFGIVPLMEPFARIQGAVETYEVECHMCDASGVVIDPETHKRTACPICLGQGSREIRKFREQEKICPNCGGMQRAADPDTGEIELCPRCQGRGLITPQEPPHV